PGELHGTHSDKRYQANEETKARLKRVRANEIQNGHSIKAMPQRIRECIPSNASEGRTRWSRSAVQTQQENDTNARPLLPIPDATLAAVVAEQSSLRGATQGYTTTRACAVNGCPKHPPIDPYSSRR